MDSDAILTAVNEVESITNPPHTPERSSYRARKTVEQILRSKGIIAGKDFQLEVLKRKTPSEIFNLV